MKPSEALVEVKKFAPEDAHVVIKYELSRYTTGDREERPTCSVYVAGHRGGSWSGYFKTFEEAIEDMRSRVEPPAEGEPEEPNITEQGEVA